MTFKLPNRNLTIEELIRYRVQYIGVECRRREFRARPIPWEQLPRTLQVALSLERKEREEREAINRELKSE